MKNLLILIIFSGATIFLGATYTPRYQISSAEKMYCWVLDTATGNVAVIKLRNDKLQIIDSIKIKGD